MLKLKLQYSGYLMWRAGSGKDSDAGKDWGQEKKGATEDEMIGWHHRLSGREFSKLQEIMKHREAWHDAAHGVVKSWSWLGDWTTICIQVSLMSVHYHLNINFTNCICLRTLKNVIFIIPVLLKTALGSQNHIWLNLLWWAQGKRLDWACPRAASIKHMELL